MAQPSKHLNWALCGNGTLGLSHCVLPCKVWKNGLVGSCPGQFMLGVPAARPPPPKPCAQSSQLLVVVVSTSLRVLVTPSAAGSSSYRLSFTRATPGSKLSCSSNCGSSKGRVEDRKSTRLNSSHMSISYAVFCLKKKKK